MKSKEQEQLMKMLMTTYRKHSIEFVNNQPAKQLYYSKAKTGIAKCCRCRKFIPKGTPLLWFWDNFKRKNMRYTHKHLIKIAKRYNLPIPSVTNQNQDPITLDLNIKKKICYRCVQGTFSRLIVHHQIELDNIYALRKRFKRSLKGKKIKAILENTKALEELEGQENCINCGMEFAKS